MEYSFYNGYQINDDDIGCNRVIVADCGGIHHYANICDLMNNCLSSIDGQLSSDCVVDFLNTLDTQTPGHFIRISATNCLESVPLSVITSDQYVGVDATDTPGYLFDKLEGCNDITISKTGTGSNKKVRICYTGPTNITQLNDTDPNLFNGCSGAGSNKLIGKFLVADTNINQITTICLEKPIATIYMAADTRINLPINDIQHGDVLNMDTHHGDTGTITTSGGISYCVAPKPGIYRLSIKGHVRVNAGVQAFRIYVGSSESSLNACVDTKFGSSHNPKQPLIFRYNETATQDTYAYFTLSGSTVVQVDTAGTTFNLRYAIDSNAGTDITPFIELLRHTLSGGDYSGGTYYGQMSSVSLQMEFLRDKPFDF